MNVNDSNTKSDPISGAGSILTKLCNARRNSDIRADDEQFLKLLDVAYAAQAKRIAELEREVDYQKSRYEGMVSDRDDWRNRCDEAQGILASTGDLLNSWARESGVEEAKNDLGVHALADRLWSYSSLEWDSLRRERDAAIQRAEEAEVRVKELSESNRLYFQRSEHYRLRLEKTEAQLSAIQAALPAERALEIAVKLLTSCDRTTQEQSSCPDCGTPVRALRAYAAALRKEG